MVDLGDITQAGIDQMSPQDLIDVRALIVADGSVNTGANPLARRLVDALAGTMPDDVLIVSVRALDDGASPGEIAASVRPAVEQSAGHRNPSYDHAFPAQEAAAARGRVTPHPDLHGSLGGPVREPQGHPDKYTGRDPVRTTPPESVMPVDPVRASGFTVVEVGAGAVRLEKDGRSFGVFVNRASAEMVAKLLLNQGTST